jgi:Fic family protein
MRLGKLAGLARTMPNPQLFVQPFIRREAWLSSRIEGTQADIGDLYTYEAAQLSPSGDKSTPPNSDVRELSNYVRAFSMGFRG